MIYLLAARLKPGCPVPGNTDLWEVYITMSVDQCSPPRDTPEHEVLHSIIRTANRVGLVTESVTDIAHRMGVDSDWVTDALADLAARGTITRNESGIQILVLECCENTPIRGCDREKNKVVATSDFSPGGEKTDHVAPNLSKKDVPLRGYGVFKHPSLVGVGSDLVRAVPEVRSESGVRRKRPQPSPKTQAQLDTPQSLAYDLKDAVYLAWFNAGEPSFLMDPVNVSAVAASIGRWKRDGVSVEAIRWMISRFCLSPATWKDKVAWTAFLAQRKTLLAAYNASGAANSTRESWTPSYKGPR